MDMHQIIRSSMALTCFEGYRQLCAEINLTQGRVDEAYRLLTEEEDALPGARWDFDNLVGTVQLHLQRPEEARRAFSRAVAQCELWLSRFSANQNAWAGKALALAGLSACGQTDTIVRANEAYRSAMGSETGLGTIREWKRQLEWLAVGVKSELLGDLLAEIFPIQRDQVFNRDQVFISYAHEDQAWVQELTKVLSPAIRNKKIDVWYDAKINKGEKWRYAIGTAMNKARAGVLLVSPNFLASDFINDHELPFLLMCLSSGHQLSPLKCSVARANKVVANIVPVFYPPQHFLYFFPDPQGQGSLRPTLRRNAGAGRWRSNDLKYPILSISCT
jgi:hypothetical protein